MKRLFTIALATALTLGLGSQNIFAQGDEDALRFSMLQFGSTARSLSVGGAFGALGADFSTLSINPAGLGVYRGSEASLSLDFGWHETESSFYGSGASAEDYFSQIASGGFVFQSDSKRYRPGNNLSFASSSFGFGVNRIANYNSESYYEGFNAENSFMDTYLEFLNNGNGVSPNQVEDIDPFGASMAYEAYLVNPSTADSNFYYSVVPNGGVQQSKRITTSGRQSEVVLSYAANLSNRLYLGATLGVPLIRYKSVSVYEEMDTEEQIDGFEAMVFQEEVLTRGAGLNVKLGAIVRATDFLRLGAAWHSPSAIGLRDQYSTYIGSDLENDGSYSINSPQGEYSYTLATPSRAIASMALISKKYGFVSVDYEWVNYASANYDFGIDFDIEDNVNDLIDKKYKAVPNLRVGGELKLDILRLRGGYALTSSPFAEGRAAGEADFSRVQYSGGVGVKEERYFVDVTFARSVSKEYDLQYNLSDENETIEGADLDKTLSSFVLSFGLRF